MSYFPTNLFSSKSAAQASAASDGVAKPEVRNLNWLRTKLGKVADKFSRSGSRQKTIKDENRTMLRREEWWTGASTRHWPHVA